MATTEIKQRYEAAKKATGKALVVFGTTLEKVDKGVLNDMYHEVQILEVDCTNPSWIPQIISFCEESESKQAA